MADRAETGGTGDVGPRLSVPARPSPGAPGRVDRPMVALVVDDDPTLLLLLETVLGAIDGLAVRSTTDPLDAGRLWDAEQPDVVLLDLHMPGLSGIELMRDLLTRVVADDFVPFVVLTGDTDRSTRVEALDAGAHDFLLKPVDPTEVVLRVRHLLETRRLHMETNRQRASLEAELAARDEARRAEEVRRAHATARVRRVIDERDIKLVFQPIADLNSGQVVGVEALSRFTAPPGRPPNEWFAEAAEVGLATSLEAVVLQLAMAQLDQLPASLFLAINLSPEVLGSGLAATAVGGSHARQVVVELTEHTQIADYAAITVQVDELRARGVRLAVDDAGAGFASLQHILRLRPDIIKLDLGLTRGIDGDPVRRALASSLVTFGEEVGAVLVAEGIETAGEHAALRALRVPLGQGYFLARPQPLPVPGRVGSWAPAPGAA